MSKNYAVAVCHRSMILSVPARHLTERAAVAYAKSYNEFAGDRQAIVIRHPFAKAIDLKPRKRARAASSCAR